MKIFYYFYGVFTIFSDKLIMCAFCVQEHNDYCVYVVYRRTHWKSLAGSWCTAMCSDRRDMLGCWRRWWAQGCRSSAPPPSSSASPCWACFRRPPGARCLPQLSSCSCSWGKLSSMLAVYHCALLARFHGLAREVISKGFDVGR